MSITTHLSPVIKTKRDGSWNYEIRIFGQTHTTGTRPSEREARRAAEEDANIAAMFCMDARGSYEQTME